MDIVEEIKNFVEEECKKPSSKYGYEPFHDHFVIVVKYGKILAEKQGADKEIVELAGWLHDIGSIIDGRENHHITGSEIAEKKLKELGYSEDRIERVKHCIYSHRGSKNIKKESKEAQIIADADSMSNFDRINGLFKAAYIYEGLTQKEAAKSVLKHLVNDWNKISNEGKELVKDKFEAVKLLLGEQDE